MIWTLCGKMTFLFTFKACDIFQIGTICVKIITIVRLLKISTIIIVIILLEISAIIIILLEISAVITSISAFIFFKS